MRANVVLSDGMNNEISKETVARKTETLERQRKSEGETERESEGEAERERGRGWRRCFSVGCCWTHMSLEVTKQWAAERSHFSDMIEAPQTCPEVMKWRLTCQGHSPISAFCPPTMRFSL